MKRALKWFGLLLLVFVLMAGALLAHTIYFRPVSTSANFTTKC